MSERRQTHLGVEEVRKLDHWCRNLRVMFHESLDVIHVGSSLVKPDYRDVDIRIVVEDEDYVRLSGSLNVKDLNMLLSYWGREQTGLPIDCQVQSLDVSSDEHDKLLSGAFPIPRGQEPRALHARTQQPDRLDPLATHEWPTRAGVPEVGD